MMDFTDQQNPTFSIAADTAHGKLNSDALTTEIESSAITIALAHISTAGDVGTIGFKAALPNGDQTVLTALVLAHQGVSPTNVEYTSQNLQRIVIAPDVDAKTARKTAVNGDGSYTNICDAARFPSDGSGAPMEWAPASGSRLNLMSTQLTMSPDCQMDKQLLFKIINGGDDGSTQKTITYAQLFDYLSEGWSVEESRSHRKISWLYEPPIILRSSNNAKIQILLSAGAMTGTISRVKLTYGVALD